jgi:CBS domain-containing protein
VGYPLTVRSLLLGRPGADRFDIRGYNEQGGMTTEHDLLLAKGLSRLEPAAACQSTLRSCSPEAARPQTSQPHRDLVRDGDREGWQPCRWVIRVHPDYSEEDPMTTAREIMTEGSEYLKEDATVADAAKRLANASIGAAPVCDASGHLRGVVTDRDLVVEVLAAGKDPASTKVVDLVHGEAVTIGADDTVEEAIRTMQQHKVRRLPVIDGTRLVGMVSQADIARSCPPDQVGQLVATISED